MKVNKELLIHWWHYYGTTIYTFDELQKFERIIDKYGPDRVLEVHFGIKYRRYKIVTLCGSTRFKEQFMEVQKRLTME